MQVLRLPPVNTSYCRSCRWGIYLPCLADRHHEVGIDHTDHADHTDHTYHTDHLPEVCSLRGVAGRKRFSCTPSHRTPGSGGLLTPRGDRNRRRGVHRPDVLWSQLGETHRSSIRCHLCITVYQVTRKIAHPLLCTAL